MDSETLTVVEIVTGRLNALGVPYLIGGSVASSLHGLYRATNDIDLAASFTEAQIGAIVAAFENDFYVDADAAHDALTHRSSFNLIYLPTMTKVDIFIPEASPWRESEWSRRQETEIVEGAAGVYVASPEDTILQKLLWYRLTGERSDRQWGDVQGVLKVQGDALDFPYMEHWAQEIGVADLLTTAREEAGE